jgi:hypothetical protein
MSSSSLGFEIRDLPMADGGLDLELWVEGSRVARARVSAEVLRKIEETLGTSREEVKVDLKQRLQDVIKIQGQFVELSEPIESPEDSLRFVSRFVWRLHDELSTGIVWYDVTESATGPESLSIVVRNKMRYEVHRKLTEPDGAARALVELHGRVEP